MTVAGLHTAAVFWWIARVNTTAQKEKGHGTHTRRKTFGYNTYMQCQDIALVMKLLNHSSQSDTLRYIGITQEECDNIYLNLNL